MFAVSAPRHNLSERGLGKMWQVNSLEGRAQIWGQLLMLLRVSYKIADTQIKAVKMVFVRFSFLGEGTNLGRGQLPPDTPWPRAWFTSLT